MSALTMHADFLSVRQLGTWIPGQLSTLFNESVANRISGTVELCIHELAINIVEHAYANHPGTISVAAGVTANGASVCFEVTDEGVGFDFDPNIDIEPGAPSIRGYGLMIVKQLASSVEYRRENEQNRWILSFEVGSSVSEPEQIDQHSSQVTRS